MSDRTGYLFAFTVAMILAYLLVVALAPAVDAITATPTPTASALGLWGAAPAGTGGPNGPAVVPNNANNGDARQGQTLTGFNTQP